MNPETVIAFVDDAAHANERLASLRGDRPIHWVVVACAPQLTRRMGKWASQSSRLQWRARWCDKLFAGLAPQLVREQDRLTTVVAQQPLPALTRDLLARHGDCRVIDARRPKFDHPPGADAAGDATPRRAPWQGPGTLASLGAALLLAFD